MTNKKRKLKHMTAIMPHFNWEQAKEYSFLMPFYNEGIKDLHINTPTHDRRKKVWAKVQGHNLSFLPNEIYMKDIKFGFMPKDNYMGWNADENKIVWADRQLDLSHHDVIALAFKGTAITYTAWSKTHNPYEKYSKFMLHTVRLNSKIQLSLPSLIQKLKSNGEWKKLRDIYVNIQDLVSVNHLHDFWKLLFMKPNICIVPKPACSLKVHTGSVGLEKFREDYGQTSVHLEVLWNKQNKSVRQKLINHIALDHSENKSKINPLIDFFEGQLIDWDEDPLLLEENVPSDYEIATRSDGTIQEEGDPF